MSMAENFTILIEWQARILDELVRIRKALEHDRTIVDQRAKPPV